MFQTDAAKKKLVERVLKLFSLGDSSRNQSEAEVELAVTKARQLMQEHALTEADLHQYGTEKAKKVAWIIKEHNCYTLARPFALYDDYVAVAVDAICDTKTFTRRRYVDGKLLHMRMFVGTEGDVAVAGELFHTLLGTLRASARARYGKGWTKLHSDYGNGFATRLAQRARNTTPAQMTDGQQQTLALVLRDKAAARDTWVMQNLKLATSRPKKIQGSSAYYEGYEDGAKVDLGNPRRRLS